MPTARAPARLSDLPKAPARLIGHFFFGTAGLTALCGGVVIGIVSVPTQSPGRLALLLGLLVYAALCAVACRLSRRPAFPVKAALFAAGLVGILLCGAVDGAFLQAARNTTLGFCALAICLIGAIVGPQASTLLAVVTFLESLVLATAGLHGGVAVPYSAMPLALTLTIDALVAVCSVAAGALIARLVDHYLDAAAEREARFRGLLKIAANWYWEQDRRFRFSRISGSGDDGHGASPTDWLERSLWQVGDVGLSEARLDAHRADLESHLPFSGLLVQRRDEHTGNWRVESLSGEPKWGADGVFRGYWGVARDVTREVRSQQALKVSEARYRELFSRSPSPFVLHRRGIVFDANEAAARLFGFADAGAMSGYDCLELYAPGERRERARERLAVLEQMPAGGALPVADAQVRSLDGRHLSVQSTAVRVATSGGLANLSIYFDITARQAVESALRRSEAMLSHLFATSPDGIALAELPSGRFAMVNPAFCRLSGFSAEEAEGRTAAEIGLWQDPAQADALTALLERQDSVTDFAAVFVAKAGARVSVLLGAGRFRMNGRDYLALNARDVTANERTRLEHAAILERASIGIAFTREGRFALANPCFALMFGWPVDGLVGRPEAAVWGAGERGGERSADAGIGELASAALAAGKAFEIEREMRRPDARRFWCRLLAQAVDQRDPDRSGTIWIAEDVTERRRLDQALAAARDASEAANLAKSAFLANTNHEIRTPLNGILGLAELALQPDLSDGRRREYLAQILDSARSLAGVMSDILDVSKIEAGRLTLDDSTFDLGETLQAVHQAHTSAARAKGVDLVLEIDPALPQHVRGDPGRLRQILGNFVSNAIKFTERGRVTVRAEATPRGDTRLAVADTGPGVDPATQERLFTPFSQGDSSTTRRFGGTGLGLSLCRELAQLMGGRVGVISRPGEGSTFWAELPLAAAEPPRRTPAQDDASGLAGRHVLIVEDNPVNMMVGVAMLEQWGLRVGQATDGRLAVDAVHDAAAAGDPFDAVLMDLQMPVMSGHDATRLLRRHFPAEVLPIIALTAAALVSERDEALRAGMDDFLTKPIDAARLRQTLLGVVTRRRGR